MRHEFTNGWNEESGRAANYITDANGVLQTAPRISSSVFTKNNATKLFSPRVGLAWDPSGRGKTSVRAGFGIYYSLIDDLSFLLNALPPANGSASFSGPLLPLIPVTPGVQPPPSCGPGVPTPCTTYAPQGVQADAYTPAVAEWSVRVEQQLNSNTALRVGYVGSHGYHGFVSLDPNTIPAQTCQSATGCVSGGTGTARGTVPQGAVYIPVQPTRPNPYLGAGFFWYTEGNSSYNALQIDLIHRLTKGLQLRANYTFSKNLDMNSALTGAQASNESQMVMNRNDLHTDYGPSALNVGQQGSISASYLLPFGKGTTLVCQDLWRLAVERDRHIPQRLSGYSGRWIEPLGRRQHTESGPAVAESLVYRGCHYGESKPVDQSRRVYSSDPGHVGKRRPGRVQRAGAGGSRYVAVQEYSGDRKGESAVSDGGLQPREPCELRHTERDHVRQRRAESVGGSDYEYGYDFAADSVWT